MPRVSPLPVNQQSADIIRNWISANPRGTQAQFLREHPGISRMQVIRICKLWDLRFRGKWHNKAELKARGVARDLFEMLEAKGMTKVELARQLGRSLTYIVYAHQGWTDLRQCDLEDMAQLAGVRLTLTPASDIITQNYGGPNVQREDQPLGELISHNPEPVRG